MSRLSALHADKRSSWRMLGYLAAPLVYLATESFLYAIVALFAVMWGIDRAVASRIHYRVRLHGTDDFAERVPRFERGHRGIVMALAFSPVGGLLASCGFEGSLRLWELETGRTRALWQLARENADGLAFSPDGRRLLVYGDGEVVVHDVDSGESTLKFDAAEGERFECAQFSSDGTRILTIGPGSHERGARCRLDIRDAASGAVVHSVSGFGIHALSPEGSVLAGEVENGERGEVQLWGCDDGTTLARFRLPQRFWPELPGSGRITTRRLYLAPEGRLVGIANTDHDHWFIDPASGEVVRKLKTAEVSIPLRVLLTAEARTLVLSYGTGYQRQGVYVYDVESGALRGHIASTRSEWGVPFALSPDGALLAVAGEDQPAKA